MKSVLLVVLVGLLVCSVTGLQSIFEFTPPVDQSSWTKACLIDNQLFVILNGSTNAIFRYIRVEEDFTVKYLNSKWNPVPIRDIHCLANNILVLDDQKVRLLDTKLNELTSYNATTVQAQMAIVNNTILIRDKTQIAILSFNLQTNNISLIDYYDSSTVPWLITTESPAVCCSRQVCWLNDNYNLYRYYNGQLINSTLDFGYHGALIYQDNFLWVAYNYTAANLSVTWVAYTSLTIDSSTYVNLSSISQTNVNAIMRRFTTVTGSYYNPSNLNELGVMLWPGLPGVLITQIFPDIVYNSQNQIWQPDNIASQVIYIGNDLTQTGQNLEEQVPDRNDFIIVISSTSIIGYLASEFELEYVRWIDPLIAKPDRVLGIAIVSISGSIYLCTLIIIIIGLLYIPLSSCVIALFQLLGGIVQIN